MYLNSMRDDSRSDLIAQEDGEPEIVSIGREQIRFCGGIQRALAANIAIPHVALAYLWDAVPMAREAIAEITPLLNHIA